MIPPGHRSPSPCAPAGTAGHAPTGLRRYLLVAMACACTAGCSVLGPAPEQRSTSTVPDEPAAAAVGSAEPATTPVIAPPPRAVPPAPLPAIPILVLRSSDSADSKEVADRLERSLGDGYALQQLTLADTNALAEIRNGNYAEWAATIAIGAAAAEFAATALDVPTVFCQIFDYEPLLAKRESLFGVEALPPLDLQLRSWQRIAGGARSLGMIVSAGDTELAAAAQDAAGTAGIDLHVEFAATDREVLYRFKRFAPSVDALWLLPNSEILSPRILRETLRYALDHNVQSIVFNESLLEWGALLSVGSDPADVAQTVTQVLTAVLSGSAASLPRVTPLTTVNALVNEQAAVALGLGGGTGQTFEQTVGRNAR
jgi:putative ABC transport system substrate-binding protein